MVPYDQNWVHKKAAVVLLRCSSPVFMNVAILLTRRHAAPVAAKARPMAWEMDGASREQGARFWAGGAAATASRCTHLVARILLLGQSRAGHLCQPAQCGCRIYVIEKLVLMFLLLLLPLWVPRVLFSVLQLGEVRGPLQLGPTVYLRRRRKARSWLSKALCVDTPRTSQAMPEPS